MSEMETSIGKTQAMILALLWNKEMYGLELQKILRIKGLKVSKSQLYQALRKLEEKNLLISRIDEIPGANRKFYRITEKGKEETKLFIQPIFNIMSELMYDVFDEILDNIRDLLKVKPEYSVLEISESSLPMFLNYFSQVLNKNGKFNVFIESLDLEDLVIQRAKSLEFTEFINLVYLENKSISLSDNAVDFILIPFYLHNDGTEWVLEETTRILKKNGSVLIIDVEEMPENLLAHSLFKIISNHSKYGVNSEEIKQYLSENYNIDHFSMFKGIFILKALKK